MDRLISEQAVIDRLSNWYSDMLETCKEHEDLIEVIKAIPSAEPCEDAINRANLISKLEILERRYGSDFYWETRKIVDKLPSVKPLEKIGHWIFHEIEDTLRWYECDQCGAEAVKEYDYCHGCGARMVKPQAESDHKCHNCKHYTSGERDGSCGSYICKHYSNWESEDKE